MEKGEKVASITFQPLFIADCEEPQKELLRVAKERNLDPNILEIKFQEVFYFVKTEASPHFEEMRESELGFLDNDEFLLRADVEIRQRFALIIELKEERKYSFSLRFSKDLRELFFTFHKDSMTSYSTPFLEELYSRIQAQKAIIGAFFRDEIKERERIALLLRDISKLGKLDRDYSILLSQSIGGGRCVEPTLLLDFQKDPSLGGRFPVVREGMRLATFLKPRSGEAGRDCKGNYIVPKEPSLPPENPLKIGSGIRFSEDSDKCEYFAEESGYLIYENYNLSITQILELPEVELRGTGSLLGGLDAPTTVIITQNDPMREALGDGAKIEAQNVEIKGNIGSASEIQAKNLTILGQTHQNSKIFATQAMISIHKGSLEAKEANITRFEAGVVRAKIARIEHARGGKIYAREIYIENLYSNLQAFAAEKIEVSEFLGEDNKFTISPKSDPELEERIDTLLRELHELTLTLRVKIKEFNDEVKEVKSLKGAADKIKAMIEENKKEGVKTPDYLHEKLQNYIHLVRFIQAHKSEIDRLQKERERINSELVEIQAPTLKGYLWSKKGWNGYNEVRFRLVAPVKEVFLAPKASYHYGLIVLDKELEITSKRGAP